MQKAITFNARARTDAFLGMFTWANGAYACHKANILRYCQLWHAARGISFSLSLNLCLVLT